MLKVLQFDVLTFLSSPEMLLTSFSLNLNVPVSCLQQRKDLMQQKDCYL